MTQVIIKKPTWAEIFYFNELLNNAQIKALPTTGVELIPAPGAGKIIVPSLSIAVARSTAGAYTNIDADFSSLSLDLGVSSVLYLAINESPTWSKLTTFLNGADQSAFASAPSQLFIAGWGITANAGNLATVVNQPLVIKVDNSAAGNLTGGHADNTLRVQGAYMIFDV